MICTFLSLLIFNSTISFHGLLQQVPVPPSALYKSECKPSCSSGLWEHTQACSTWLTPSLCSGAWEECLPNRSWFQLLTSRHKFSFSSAGRQVVILVDKQNMRGSRWASSETLQERWSRAYNNTLPLCSTNLPTSAIPRDNITRTGADRLHVVSLAPGCK